MKEDIEVITGAAGVLSNQALFVGFLNRTLEDGGFVVEFAPDIDVGRGTIHSSTGDKTAFDKFMGILAHDLAVLACSRLAFIGIDDEIARLGVLFPAFDVHE